MAEKQFRLSSDEIVQLVGHIGGCMATDMITVDGRRVGYMYREPPDNEADSGWRFMAGDESDAYMDNPNNHGIYAVNTIANYDRDIIPFINAPIGSAFARDSETADLRAIESPIHPDECLHPDFPVVTGEYQLNADWRILLPLTFSRRIEEGALVLWRPGITLYFAAWNNAPGEPIGVRLAKLKLGISSDAFDPQEHHGSGISHFSYRLVEDGVDALYGFVLASHGHLQVSTYFDNQSDIELARSMFASVDETAA